MADCIALADAGGTAAGRQQLLQPRLLGQEEGLTGRQVGLFCGHVCRRRRPRFQLLPSVGVQLSREIISVGGTCEVRKHAAAVE